MAPRLPAAADEALMKVRIGVVPDPGPQTARDYTPRGSGVPGLNDMLWQSYTSGEWMVVSCPPGMEGKIREELLKAKNYLNHLHRDDVPKVDIRGLEKASVQLVDPDHISDARLRTAYRKIIPVGQVGVRFQARPPLMKGKAVVKAREREEARRGAASARKPGARQAAARSRAASTRESINSSRTAPAIPFSG